MPKLSIIMPFHASLYSIVNKPRDGSYGTHRL